MTGNPPALEWPLAHQLETIGNNEGQAYPII